MTTLIDQLIEQHRYKLNLEKQLTAGKDAAWRKAFVAEVQKCLGPLWPEWRPAFEAWDRGERPVVPLDNGRMLEFDRRIAKYGPPEAPRSVQWTVSIYDANNNRVAAKLADGDYDASDWADILYAAYHEPDVLIMPEPDEAEAPDLDSKEIAAWLLARAEDNSNAPAMALAASVHYLREMAREMRSMRLAAEEFVARN